MSSKPRSLADAQQCWCPFFRRSQFDQDASYTTNRDPTMMRETVCLGPECMAWRDVEPPPEAPKNETWGVCDLIPGDTAAVRVYPREGREEVEIDPDKIGIGG